MSNEQANNKLPEKTIQEQVEEIECLKEQNAAPREDDIIGDLKNKFLRSTLENQQKVKFSISEIVGNIALAYHRGLSVGQSFQPHQKKNSYGIKQQIEERANFIYSHQRQSVSKGIFTDGALFASSLFEAELSEKDKLIELTNNNLLAALEEVKRLKELTRKAFETFYFAPFPHNNPTWEDFCKENNIEP